MTSDQERHLADIKETFCKLVEAKYRAGQAEHGGNLLDRDTLTDSVDEAIDIVTYIFSSITKRDLAIKFLAAACHDLKGLEQAESARFNISTAITLLTSK